MVCMQSALQTCMQSDLSYELLVNAICRDSRLALLNDFIFNSFSRIACAQPSLSLFNYCDKRDCQLPLF
jgi:hypothetical protein